ncbi:MAG: DUF2793 domain-containing protein [Paracoccaceae bacterium]
MSDQSTILSLPHILPSQAQKHVTHNEALRLLDVMVQLSVTQRTLGAPPASPALGDRHIVGVAPTGDWAAHQDEIALWNGSAWEFFAPLQGWRAYVAGEAAVLVYDGSGWTMPGGMAEFDRLGVAMPADAVNKLAVAAPAALFTNPAGSHQMAISKAAAGDTGSVLFQQNFVSHAEIGLVGDNDLAVKVSPDGSSFQGALRADRTSGRVTFDQPLRLAPAAGDAVGVGDGFLWYNATTGKFRARQAGADVDLIGAGAGSGDVVGPAAASDHALARFDLATGKLLQNSAVTLSDAGDLALPTGDWPAGAWTLARAAGANGALSLSQRGTGALQLVATDAAEIGFSTNGATRARLSATGAFLPGANLGTPIGELATRFSEIFAQKVNLGSTSADGVALSTGAGAPEGVVTGSVGSVYLRGDGAGGTSLYVKESGAGNTGWTAFQADRWTYLKLAADSVVSTVAHADVAGMSFTALADTVYEIEIFGAMQSAATTTGIGVALKIPSGTVDGMTIVPNTTTSIQAAMQRADDAIAAPTTAVATAAVNWPIFGKYLVAVGATGGAVQLRQRSEVAGSSTTLMAGLRMKVRQIPA